MTIQIFIRQHKFNVACSDQNESLMRTAARGVEDKIHKLREKNQVVDGERVALMAALQIAFEAQSTVAAAAPPPPAINIDGILKRIGDTLERTDSSLQRRVSSGVNQ